MKTMVPGADLKKSPVHNEHERNKEEDGANVGTAVCLHRREGVSQPSLANRHPKQGEESQVERTIICRRNIAEEGNTENAICRNVNVKTSHVHSANASLPPPEARSIKVHSSLSPSLRDHHLVQRMAALGLRPVGSGLDP